MSCVIVDYNSGNLRSAEKSFQRMANELDAGDVIVSSDPDVVRKADRIVLPGVGAFADCRRELGAIDGLFGAIEERVNQGTPFFGICVGMQMMAERGLEHGTHAGFGWIAGDVTKITPADSALKVPHMGWNALQGLSDHPLWDGLSDGDHAYFVHSYHLATSDERQRAAVMEYGQVLTAAVARDNLFGTQFHPEKSQEVGLKLIGNFLTWTP